MRTVALSVAISVGATGCAVAAARGPEPGPVRADHRPDCNTGKGGVVADGLGATVLGISTLGLAAADEGGIAALTGLATVGLIASAVAGSRSADRCSAALEDWEGLVLARRTQDLADERREARAARGVAVKPPAKPPVPVEPPPAVVTTTPTDRRQAAADGGQAAAATAPAGRGRGRRRHRCRYRGRRRRRLVGVLARGDAVIARWGWAAALVVALGVTSRRSPPTWCWPAAS
jgi:hypothetical protein